LGTIEEAHRNPSSDSRDGFSVLRRNGRPRTGIALLLGIACCLFAGAALARQNPPVHPPEIRHLSFAGNVTFDDGVLRGIIVTRESPGWLSKFFYHTFGEKLGSHPEYFSQPVFDDDRKLLTEFYQNRGFYHCIVEGEVRTDSGDNSADLLFMINEGRRSYIDSVLYLGIDTLPAPLREQIAHDPIQHAGMPYENIRDAAEKDRILGILFNSGYPMARIDAAHSAAYHLASSDNFHLVFSFMPGRQYTFDSIAVRVDPPRGDLTPNLILRQMDFEKGDLYSREKKISSERNLNRLGLFETAIIDRGSPWDSSTSTSIPMEVSVRPRVRNELSPELIVSDENNAFTMGLGLGYTMRNFLGDARTLTARTQARTQSLTDLIVHGRSLRDPAVIGAVDLEFQLVQPYVFTRSLTGSWTFTLSAEKQSIYILSILRNKFGFSKQFASYTFGFFEWTLERVNPEIIPGTGDTVQANAFLSSLQEAEKPQFNSILTVTLQRDKTNDIFSPTQGFFHSISLEESGILPKLLSRDRNSSLPFTQYYKATLLGRWYYDLSRSRFNILAMKLKSGYQNKYGESRSLDVAIPLNRRYFAGGSGSVRGWKARELGAMSTDLIQLGGNFLLEGSAEMRVNHFRGFGRIGPIRMENVWAVYFLDFGNVWSDLFDFKPVDIAVAAGLGIRYDTFFGPFRIDFGFRVYDPQAPQASNTIFRRRFWGETLGQGVIQFGIGQAF
jgi:outer membrane protein insertion porin family